MDEETRAEGIDFAMQLRRSRGRGGRTFSATAKVTREEHTELEAAARAEGKALGEWARELLLGAARRGVTTPVFTEVVAIRMMLNTVLGRIAQGETLTAEDFVTQMQTIRTTKNKAAEEVMQQYVSTPPKAR